MTDSDSTLVVRHGVDKQGSPFTSTFELVDASNGTLEIRQHTGTHPPQREYTPEEFVAAGYHLEADCGGVDCDRPRHKFSSVEEPALD